MAAPVDPATTQTDTAPTSAATQVEPAPLPDQIDVETAYDRHLVWFTMLNDQLDHSPDNAKSYAQTVELLRKSMDAEPGADFEMQDGEQEHGDYIVRMATLDLMRYLPYAELGYRFKQSAILRFFLHYSWYKPSIDDADIVRSRLTRNQATNIDHVAAYERKHWKVEFAPAPSSQDPKAGLLSLWTDASGAYNVTQTIAMTGQDIRTALEKGADKDARNKDGCTTLMIASLNGNIGVVNALLSAGADTEVRDNNGLTALIYAAHAGQSQAVSALIEAGANKETTHNKGGTALMEASALGNVDVVKTLLKAGANIDAKQPSTGITALILAADVGKTEVVKILIDAGANKEAKSAGIGTALIGAIAMGRIGCVKLLVAAGADIETKNEQGSTPLMVAAALNRLDVVQILIAAGAKVNAFGKNRITALTCAAMLCRPQVTIALLKAGANKTLKDRDGHDALYYAMHAVDVSQKDQRATIAALKSVVTKK